MELSISNSDFSINENETFENESGEVEPGETAGNFTLKFGLSRPAVTPVTFDVNLNLVGNRDTAVEGSDYTEFREIEVRIEPGSQTGSFTIPIINDDIFELSESFAFSLTGLKGAVFATDQDGNDINSGTITIIDDDPAPELSVTNTSFRFSENDTNASLDITFTPTLTEASSFNVTMSKLSGDTAVADTDFLAVADIKHNVNSGSSTYSVPISLIDNVLLNSGADKTFTITISDLVNLRFSDNATSKPYTITIVDDESTTISVKNTRFSVDEDISGGVFIMRLGISNAIDVNVSVEYDLTSISAIKTTDFTEPTLRYTTIPAGDTLGTFSIPIIHDILHEGNETFKITLKNPIGAVFASREATHDVTITIVDDEYPTVLLTSTNLYTNENVAEGEIEVSVSLSGASNRKIAVNYSTADDTAIMGEDYTHQQGVLNFTPGTTEKKITVPILDDTAHEGAETFNIEYSISIGGAIFADGETTGTNTISIVDNESPTLSISNTKSYVSEDVGSSGYSLDLELTGPTTQVVTLNFAVNGGTAVVGTDYNVSSQTINFALNSITKSIPIAILDDEVIEGNKTIRLTLSNLTGAIFPGGGDTITRTITIVDDERTIFSLSNTSFKVDENVTGGNFDLSYALKPASPYDVTYTVSTQDGTAIKGQDYTELETQTITIPAGTTTGTISIPILNDTDSEGEQSFTIKVENVVGAVIEGDVDFIEKTITIADDEVSTIFLDDILNAENIIEGYGDYEMNLRVSPVVNSPINISFSTMALTATSGTDYTAPADQTMTIGSGTNEESLSGFTIPNNSTRDGDKIFKISLSITSGSAVFLGGRTEIEITMKIIDDESLVLTTTISSSYVNEDVGEVFVRYSLASAISSTVSFNVELSNGISGDLFSAMKGSDYEDVQNSTITILPGKTSGAFAIPIIDDTDTESNEGFTVELTNLRNAVFNICSNCNTREKEHIVRIAYNDFPTLSYTSEDFTVVEAESETYFTLNLRLSSSHFLNSEFSYEFTDGSAKQGIDYTVSPAFLSTQRFIQGQTTISLSIRINYNPSYTGNKIFTVSLVSPLRLNFPDGAEMIDGQLKYSKTVTIIDKQSPAIQITTTNFNVAENVSGGNFVVNYVLSNPAIRQVSFDYNFIDVSTTKNSDYTEASTRTATIEKDSSSGSISIPIINDDKNEGNETFTLVLSNLVGGSGFVGGSITHSQTVTILDDEPPTLSIANTELNVDENVGAEGFVVELMLTGPTTDQDPATNQVVTVDYVLNDGTAMVGTDYTQPISRSIAIPEGSIIATFTIPILDDATNPIVEGNEDFTMIMNIRSGAKFDNGSTSKTYTITIFDNELPTLSFPTTAISAVENVDAAEITASVNLSVVTHQDVTFEYGMTDGTATKGVDFLEVSDRSVTISAGSTSKTFTIPIVDDLYNEGNETLTLELSNPVNAKFANGETTISKILTIIDNELPTLKLTTVDFEVDENVGSDGFVLNFELSGPTGQAVTFVYDLTDGIATEGVDYTEVAEAQRTVTIPIGDTTKSIKIPILDDSANEGDETFTLALSDFSGAVFESGESTFSTTVKIHDDEQPTLSISNTTFKVFEDAGNYILEMMLSGPTEADVTFKYSLTDSTATKTNGSDYTEVAEAERTLTIAGGETTKVISIPITDDSISEEDETFTITLSDISGAVFASGTEHSETITIIDDDSITLSISTTDFSVFENVGTNGFVVNVGLSESTNLDVTLDYDLTDLTATEGMDYLEDTNRSVSIPSGTTKSSFSIQILDDLELEGTQSFSLTISNLKGAIFANNVTSITKTVSIIDNETPNISISTTNFKVSEGVGVSGFELNVELYETSPDDVTMTYSTEDISAEQGVDYINSSGSVIIASGTTAGSLSIPITDDSETEVSKTFRIALVAQGGAEFESNHLSLLNVIVTILDNEAPQIAIADGPMVTESDVSGTPAYARFVISSLVEPVTNNFTIQYTPNSSAFVTNSGTARTSHGLNFSDPDNDGVFTAELRVEIASDSQAELNGNLDVTLNADTVGSEKYYLGSTTTASVFVVDDDAAIPELSLDSMSTPIAESAGSVEFTILASEDPGRDLTDLLYNG